jgi:hypothetical protein
MSSGARTADSTGASTRRCSARKSSGTGDRKWHAKRRNPHVGSNFEALLAEEGLEEASTVVATKRVLAWQIAEAMQDANVSRRS